MKKYLALFLCIVLVLSSCIIVSNATNTGEGAIQEEVQEDLIIEQDDGTYAEYLNTYVASPMASEDIEIQLNKLLSSEPLTFNVEAPSDGFYHVGMSYMAVDDAMGDLEVGMQIDDNYPYTAAKEFMFPRMWKDAEQENNVDDYGNEFSAQQIPYDDFYFNITANGNSEEGEDYLIHLSKGVHKITLVATKGKMQIENFTFVAPEQLEIYKEPSKLDLLYSGKPIVLEGEDAVIKSNYFLAGKTDTASVKVTPHNPKVNVINYIGGGNWKHLGDTIVWETPELEAGYYQLGFSFRQNQVIGGKTYRTLTVDGETPFKEAKTIGFAYDDDWQQKIYSDKNETPYLIYLSEGKHEIALKVTSGETSEVRTILMDAVAAIGDLYIDITVITGEKVDTYRDYELFKQIPDMEERLTTMRTQLTDAAKLLQDITGEESGSNYSVIMNMVEVIDQMLDNKFEAHRYKQYYYDTYCSVSSVLQDMRNMPLDLDKIVLTQSGEEEPFEKAGFFEGIWFGIMRFFMSFIRDYNGVSSSSEADSITIWVNWGRDQAQVLSSLVKRSFTPETGINVNIQLTNASIIQATLSGNGLDCILQHSRSEPVNLAMRGVLYDLRQFEDCEDVLERFQDGAEIPYCYKDGLYALPDTQSFYMMFYRKDIFNEYNLKVPETWEDFEETSKLLMRHNMSVWLQNTPATNTAQVNAGVGSNNVFPSLLLQRGLSLYSEDGKSTTLLSSDSMETFEYWTNYYTKLKLPITQDFYNRFRVGTTPMGIMPYTFYTTLKTAAPEIDGLWGMTEIPGTVCEDGTISHISSGGGTGCAILQQTDNPEAAWEFLKWWTSADTQRTFSNDVESILGPSGRVALANVEAISGLEWDDGAVDELLNAWSNVVEIPEYPGSYYVSRSIYQGFWNVVNDQQNPKNMLMRYGKEADQEIERKWLQYQERGK